MSGPRQVIGHARHMPDPSTGLQVSLAGRFDAAYALRADRRRVRGVRREDILSPGPSLMSPLAVWNTIWRRTQYSTFS